jgi:hypothetical protein
MNKIGMSVQLFARDVRKVFYSKGKFVILAEIFT